MIGLWKQSTNSSSGLSLHNVFALCPFHFQAVISFIAEISQSPLTWRKLLNHLGYLI